MDDDEIIRQLMQAAEGVKLPLPKAAVKAAIERELELPSQLKERILRRLNYAVRRNVLLPSLELELAIMNGWKIPLRVAQHAVHQAAKMVRGKPPRQTVTLFFGADDLLKDFEQLKRKYLQRGLKASDGFLWAELAKDPKYSSLVTKRDGTKYQPGAEAKVLENWARYGRSYRPRRHKT